jgi:hypothetical protein
MTCGFLIPPILDPQKVCARFVALCRELGLLATASVAIDGSKFKAVNNRDKNFTRAKMQRRLAQIEESVARYLSQLDTADLQEPSEALATKTAHLKERFALPNRRDVGLARANAHSVFDVEDKYFTIPDLPGLRGRSDGLDGSVGQLARDCHLNLDLGYKSNCIFGPAIELAIPLWRP